MMNMTSTTVSTTVRWHVVGYREAVYQVAPGEPYRPAGCCDKCGQGIRYVYKVRSTAGDVMEVGSGCAVTLEGGPELAELRRAEREYEHEQWLKSPEYARQRDAEAARKAARAARAAAAEVEHALTLAGLRAIQASPNCSRFDREESRLREQDITKGDDFCGVGDWDVKQLRTMSVAVRKAYLPASRHVGSVGERIEFDAVLETMIPVDTAYGTSYVQKFRRDDGAVLVWFSKGGDLRYGDIGKRVHVRGTVKGHKEYDGQQETTLTRCKAQAAKANV